MNIRFGKIHASNFLSFRDVDFDFSQFGGKTVLISGINGDIANSGGQSNGSGKSTIFQALLFAVYGETMNSGKASHIRNWNCGAKDAVEVNLEVFSNEKQYIIKRRLSGKKAASELHVFSVNSDGETEEATRSTIAETQKMIETDIVPCGKEGFLRCVVLTADQNYNFFNLGKAAKNEFFESLFELSAFTEAYNALHRQTLDEGNSLIAESRTIDQIKDNIRRLERDRDEARRKQSGMDEAKAELSEANRRLFDFYDKSDLKTVETVIRERFAKEISEAVFDGTEKLVEYDRNNGIVASNGSELSFSEEIEDYVSREMAKFNREHGISMVNADGTICFGKSEEWTKKVDEGKSLSLRIKNGERLCSELKADNSANAGLRDGLERKMRSNLSSIEDMAKRLSAHSRITEILCEKCVGKYEKSVSIDGLGDQIDELRRENERISAEIASYDAKIAESTKKLGKYETAIDEMKTRRDELRADVASLVAGQRLLQKEHDMQLSAAKAHVENEKTRIVRGREDLQRESARVVDDLKSRMESEVRESAAKFSVEESRLKSAVSNAEYKMKTLSETQTKSFDAPIRSLSESLEESRRRYGELDKSLAHRKALEAVMKPENIRKSVVADMLRELNFRICGYLTKMGSNYSCSFDENFDATFTSSKGVETEYGFFSAGERMRLSIACCFAFRDFMQVRLNIRPNILAIDEYIDSNLDENAVSGIMELIRFMVASEGMAAFIISHRSEIKNGMFDSEVVVTKKNDESNIEIRQEV